MPLVPFFLQTFIGATIWGTVLIFIGYELGNWAVIAEKLKHVDLLIGLGIVAVLLDRRDPFRATSAPGARRR